MNRKCVYGVCFILAIMVVACSFRHKEEPIDPELLPGEYYNNQNGRDSIFIYPDKTYKHTYHKTNGTVKSQTYTWRYKPNDVFFDRFVFYNDKDLSESGYFSGSWSPRVFITEEGHVKLRYSESVYYLKTTKEIANPDSQNK